MLRRAVLVSCVLCSCFLVLGCALPLDGGASATVAAAGELAGLAEQEVHALHRFIEQWSRGELADTDAEYARFSTALAPEFVLVGTEGERAADGSVAAGFRSAYGRWREAEPARIEVRNVHARALSGQLAIADYEEWHFVGSEVTARRSSVLMRRAVQAPGGVEWVHLHETWIKDVAPRPAPADGTKAIEEGSE